MYVKQKKNRIESEIKAETKKTQNKTEQNTREFISCKIMYTQCMDECIASGKHENIH